MECALGQFEQAFERFDENHFIHEGKSKYLEEAAQSYMDYTDNGKFILLPQFNTCSSSGVSDRLLVKKSFDLLRVFLNASHMGFGMFFKLPIPFCRRSFGKGRFQIPVQ